MLKLKEQFEELKASYYTRVGQRDGIIKNINTLTNEIAGDKRDIVDLESLGIIYKETAEEARKQYTKILADNVTAALQHIFGPDFKFDIELKEARGRPEVEFYVEHEQDSIMLRNKPQDAMGGGVVDIVSAALQISIKHLYQNPVQRGPLILDEPGKHVSEEYAIKFGNFLSDISRALGLQIIMNTHQRVLADQADKVMYMEIRKGQSIVQETTASGTKLRGVDI